MAFHTPPDITGDGAVHNLQDLATANGYGNNLTYRGLQLIVTGSGTCRIGDSNTSSARGLPIAAGAGMFYPYFGQFALNALGSVYLYVPVGATASVAWED